MPNNLPLNWCECKLEDLGKFFGGYAFKSSEYSSSGARVVRITNVQRGFFEDRLPKFYPVQSTLDVFCLQHNDILISLTGNVGRVCKITQEYLPAYLNQRVEAFRVNNNVCTNFIYYLMQQQDFEKKCIQHSKGVAQKNISPGFIKKYTMLFPPLAEQERIVAKIEALFANIDAGVERLKVAQAQIKQYRQSVLSAAFKTNKKGTITDIVKFVKIGPFGSLLHKSDYVKNGIPLVNPSHIKNLHILSDNNICISTSKVKELGAYSLQEGDIILGRRGEMGRCAVVTKEQDGWLCGTGSMFLRLKTNISALFYALYISSQPCVQYLENNAMGTTMKNLNEKIIKKVPIPLLPLSEQQRIVAEIENRFTVADELEKSITDALTKAEKLKQSILKQAFEGKLVPQDPNDEPASALLERIKKSQTPTKGKKK